MGNFFWGGPEGEVHYKDYQLKKSHNEVSFSGGFLSKIPMFGITYNDYDLVKGDSGVSFGRHIEPKGSNSKAKRKNNLLIYTN